MSRLQKPINERVLWSTGDLILWAELDLLLKDSFGNWQVQSFRVDSATDMTTLPAYDAMLMSIPFHQSCWERGKFAALPSCSLRWRPGGVSHPADVSPWRQMMLSCRVIPPLHPRVAVLLGGDGANAARFPSTRGRSAMIPTKMANRPC